MTDTEKIERLGEWLAIEGQLRQRQMTASLDDEWFPFIAGRVQEMNDIIAAFERITGRKPVMSGGAEHGRTASALDV